MMVAMSSPFVARLRSSRAASSTPWPRRLSSAMAPSSMTRTSRSVGARSFSPRTRDAMTGVSATTSEMPASVTIHSTWSADDVS